MNHPIRAIMEDDSYLTVLQLTKQGKMGDTVAASRFKVEVWRNDVGTGIR